MSPSETGAARIGYVLKMYPRFSETFIVNEILALEAQGADLEILSLRGPVDGRFHENLARIRAPVTYLPVLTKPSQLWESLGNAQRVLPEALEAHLAELLAAAPGDAAQALDLACHIAQRRIDHLHAHFGSVATSVARLASKLAGVTYSFTAHAKDIFHEEVDHEDMRTKLREASAVVTVSDFNVRFLRRTYGDDAAGVVRIYNGVDLDAFARTPYTHRPPVVVGVGRLVEKKGFCHLVDAVARLRKDGTAVELELVGTGPEEEALRGRVDDLGLHEVVRFLGPLPQGRIREVVSQAAVFAAPCVVGADGNRDGLPTVLLESLALGTPVVSTPVTGIPEAVVPGRTGLLVPEGDPVALAEALRRLVEDPDLAARLADAGRRHVEATFDVARNTRLLHDLMRAAAPGREGVV